MEGWSEEWGRETVEKQVKDRRQRKLTEMNRKTKDKNREKHGKQKGCDPSR